MAAPQSPQVRSFLFYQLARELAHQNQRNEAREAFKAAWEAHQASPEPLLCWARWEHQWEDDEAAYACLNLAYKHCPEDAEVHYHFGLIFHASGQLEYALRYFRSALERNPLMAEAWHQLGRLLQQLERPNQARDALLEALDIEPNNPTYHSDLGVLAYLQKWSDTARQYFESALKLAPRKARFAYHLGLSYLLEPRDLTQARKAFVYALNLDSTLVEELYRSASQSLELHLLLPAQLLLEVILDHVPEHVDARFLLGRCFEQLEQMENALKQYQKAYELAPERSWLKIKAMLLMPWIYANRQDMVAWRTRFATHLASLLNQPQLKQRSGILQTLQLKPMQRKFIFQNYNDRPLLESLDQLWRQILPMPSAPALKVKRRLQKIAIVSAHFYQNSLMMGLLPLLQDWKAAGHELHFVAMLDLKQDEVHHLIKSLGKWHPIPKDEVVYFTAEKLIKEEFSRIIYPEVGLDLKTMLLSHARLAPVQIALYGMPLSSGQQSLDYFLSPRIAEPQEAQSYYSEQWVGLPHFLHQAEYASETLQNYPQIPIPDLPPSQGRLLLLAGPLPAFDPVQDAAILELLKQNPADRLLCVNPPGTLWAHAFAARLSKYLDEKRLICCEINSQSGWLPFLQCADLLIEPWNCNSLDITLTALSLGKLMVSLPGRFLRNRLSSGLYQKVGLNWPIAEDTQDWLYKNQCLLQDSDLRYEMKHKADQAILKLPLNGQEIEELSQIILGLEAR